MTQHDGLKTFLELSENGSSTAATAPPSPRRAIIDLVTYAEARGILATNGSWRLLSEEARRMEDALGYSPVGGWGALVAVVSGTGTLVMHKTGAYAKQKVKRWHDMSDDEARRVVAEAFFRYLVPPATAAGLFVALRMHALWGLKIAKEQGGAGPDIFDEKLAALFEDADLDAGETAIFGTLAALLAGMASLSPEQAYPMDALSAFLGACIETAYRFAREQWDPKADKLPLFIDELETGSLGARQLDSVINDIFAGVLAPAGVARRLDDNRFVIHPVIHDIGVGGLSLSERQSWLGWVTATEPRFLVA